MKRICKTCNFFTKEWSLQWTRDSYGAIQEYLELDKYCRLCDVFKKETGYCDMWELNA